ncbi:MAG: YqiA/YcfP family alpha/beta fold hydrolase [bacterium]
MVIYIHGFASAGGGEKYHALKDVFAEEEVLSPTLPVAPFEAIEAILTLLDRADKPSLLIGTSLGGFYAYYLSVKLLLPAVIINPALEPWKTLRLALGYFRNLATGELFRWREEYLLQLQQMAAEMDKNDVEDRLLRFYISTDDELIDHSRIRERVPPMSEILYFNHSGHRFTRFREVAPQFKSHFEAVKPLLKPERDR